MKQDAARIRRPAGLPAAVFLPVLLCLLSGCDAERRITEQRVLETLETLREATLQQNSDTVADLLSPEFTARVVVPSRNRPEVMVMGRGDYVRHLRLTFRTSRPLSLDRTKTTVEIAGDGKSARATYTLNQTDTVNNRLEERSTQNTVILELESGRLRIKSVHQVDL